MSSGNSGIIQVAVGIIINDGKVLCCQRKEGARYGLLWEFPGGKVKHRETPQDCLERELREELGIAVSEMEPYGRYIQTYADDGVFEVNYFMVKQFGGKLKNNAFKTILWLSPAEFDSVPFLEGNKPILKQLQHEFAG